MFLICSLYSAVRTEGREGRELGWERERMEEIEEEKRERQGRDRERKKREETLIGEKHNHVYAAQNSNIRNWHACAVGRTANIFFGVINIIAL